VGLFQAAGSLFWLTLEGESQVWEVDPERAEVRALPMTDGIQDMKPFHLAPPYAFFRSGLAGWYEDASLRRQFLRAKWEEGRWTDLQELTMGINDELIVSPTGLGYLRIVDPPGTKIQSGRTGLVKVLSPNGRYQLTFARWPAGQPGGQPQDQVATWEWISWSERSPQWHESGRSLVLHSSSYLSVVVFELASGKHHEHLGWASRRQTTQAIATDYGWLMGRPDQWMALGHDGQKLGVLPVNLPADFDGHINETPRGTWILSDGRSCPLADGPRYFVGRRGPEFVTIPWSQCPSELSLPTYPTDTPIEVLIRESQRP